MNQNNEFVAAIDIGTTKIVALIGKKDNNGKLRVMGLGKAPSKGVKHGVILNIEETVNAIRTAVETAQATAGVKFKDVYVGIAGRHIRSVKNRGYKNRETYEDEISREDVQELIRDMYRMPIDAGEQIIHVLPQNYIVDNEVGVKFPVGMFGKRLEANFHIVIGQVTSINNIGKCIDRVGLHVNELILEPLASSYAVLTADEKEAGVALVDIGGGTTDVAVYYDSIIRHTAVIPFGGNVITNDIKTYSSILERQAEELKLQFGSALAVEMKDNEVVTVPGISGRDPKEISLKSLAHVIQSRMEEIIGLVTFQLDQSGFGDKLGAGIVITGGGALLKNLPQLFAYKTGMDIRIGQPIEHLASDVTEEINQTMYATGIGLLLTGFDELKEKLPVAETTQKIADKQKIKNSKEAVKNKKEETEDDDDDESEDDMTENKQEERRRPLKGLFQQFSRIFDQNDPQM